MTNDERQTVIQALEAVDALIDHQFTGTRAGMTALQHACDDCREALGIMRREPAGPCTHPRATYGDPWVCIDCGFEGPSPFRNKD